MKGIIQKQHAQINKEEILLLFLSITACSLLMIISNKSVMWQPSAALIIAIQYA